MTGVTLAADRMPPGEHRPSPPAAVGVNASAGPRVIRSGGALTLLVCSSCHAPLPEGTPHCPRCGPGSLALLRRRAPPPDPRRVQRCARPRPRSPGRSASSTASSDWSAAGASPRCSRSRDHGPPAPARGEGPARRPALERRHALAVQAGGPGHRPPQPSQHGADPFRGRGRRAWCTTPCPICEGRTAGRAAADRGTLVGRRALWPSSSRSSTRSSTRTTTAWCIGT